MMMLRWLQRHVIWPGPSWVVPPENPAVATFVQEQILLLVPSADLDITVAVQ
ncbi:MAG: hypothetical protein R2867_22145 [Caldilineaceae bacterium]